MTLPDESTEFSETPTPILYGMEPAPAELVRLYNEVINNRANGTQPERIILSKPWSEVLRWNIDYITGATIRDTQPVPTRFGRLERESSVLLVPESQVVRANYYLYLSRQNIDAARAANSFYACIRLWGISFLQYHIDSDSD